MIKPGFFPVTIHSSDYSLVRKLKWGSFVRKLLKNDIKIQHNKENLNPLPLRGPKQKLRITLGGRLVT